MEPRGTDGEGTERWRRAAIAGALLVIGLVAPSPLGRHPEFSRVGPDKLLHVVGHAGFAATLADALATADRDRPTAGVLAVVGSMAVGLCAAGLQRWVPGRVPERADTVAGLVGSVLGVWWLFRRTGR
jgi:VanZ family protein